MKTTVEITDTLFAQARQIAARDGMTFRALLEEGLRKVVADREHREPYIMPDRSVGGTGLSPEFQNATWDQIMEAIYEGRGA